MAGKLEVCPHCRGRKVCQASGGRSCRDCLAAAGMGRKSWAAVRCSYCGGSGFVRPADQEPPAPLDEEEKPPEPGHLDRE